MMNRPNIGETSLPKFGERASLWRKLESRNAVCLMLTGILVNYVALSHSFLPLGVHPPGNSFGGVLDLILPMIAFFLIVSGVVLLIVGMKSRAFSARSRRHLGVALLISLPISVLYGFFYFGIQFMNTGSDRLGECAGLAHAAESSNEIPDSTSRPGTPAIGCSMEEYGIFLTRYNMLSVYGLTSPEAQQRVLQNIQQFRNSTHTHAVRVAFYERENWTAWRNERNGASGGERGPENLFRVVTLR